MSKKNSTKTENATSASSRMDPRDLIKRQDVEKALSADKGPLVKLASFSVKDFTSKGDNYFSTVSSVQVEYTKNGNSYETSYVVKLNPCRNVTFECLAEVVFKNEIGFYTEVLPLLNKELELINEKKLRMPQHLHSISKESEQVIYLNDLRRLGYKMYDRKRGMDKAHSELIIKELARIHAASVLLMSNDEFRGIDFLDRFPFLNQLVSDSKKKEVGSIAHHMQIQALENGAKIAERSNDYQFVADFLRSKKGSLGDDLKSLMVLKEPFRVICHGDCWINNFLFRYGRGGGPVECCLLDLQNAHVGSPAVDLNYMLYCSLNGDVRASNMTSFHTTYYASFASTLAAARRPVSFTLPHFVKEFYAKNLYGLLMSLILIPIILMESEDAPSFEDFTSGDLNQRMQEWQNACIECVVQKSSLLTPRFLSICDEMKETGLFTTRSVSKLVENFNSLRI